MLYIVYEAYREINSANYYLKEDMWIHPGVGIVKMSVREFNLPPIENQVWS